jgi:hypothetical protein
MADESCRIALITMVCNEARYLPIWLAYYRRIFASADIYILDNDTTDGSTRDLPAQVIPVSCGYFFHEFWRTHVIDRKQQELIKQYDAVIYVDIDEFLVPDPQYRDLREFVTTHREHHAIRARGYEIVQDLACEPPLDWTTPPLLAQRRLWAAARLSSKPALTYVPVRWTLGFHNLLDPSPPIEVEDLYLLHIHKIDFRYCIERHRAIRARLSEWHPLVLVEHNTHYQAPTDEAVNEWYRQSLRQATPMPEWVRTVL